MSDHENSRFSIILKILREESGLSQNDISVKLGIGRTTYTGYERGNIEPPSDKLQKLADIFHVSTDYLLGRTPWILCPICHYNYDPANKFDSIGHDRFHERYIKAEKKYGELLSSYEASKRREENIFRFRNSSLSLDERVKAYEEYLRYDFLLSLWKNNLDLAHEDFETFCKKDIGLVSTKEALEDLNPEIYQRLVDKYGIADEESYHIVPHVEKLNEFYNSEERKSINRINNNIIQLNEDGLIQVESYSKDLLKIEDYRRDTLSDAEIICFKQAIAPPLSVKPTRLYTYMQKIACAGGGFVFEDIPTDVIEAPYMEGADFIIGVNGDSMEPTYYDGDKVYVEKMQMVEIGDIGIFVVNNECFIKEAGKDGLISHNPKYPIIPGTESIQCIGKVLGKVELSDPAKIEALSSEGVRARNIGKTLLGNKNHNQKQK